MCLSLCIIISCNIALTLGFELSKKRCVFNNIDTTLVPVRTWIVIILFALIGICATIMNRGAYKGGFVSGIYVIINFFASYIDYLLVLILIALYKKIKIPKFIYLLLFCIVFLQIDKLLISVRRGEAIQFVLTLSFFYFFIHHKEIYHRYKFIIPFFFIVGMMLNSQIGKYRENSYSGKFSVIENINRIEITNKGDSKSLKNLEMNNAMVGINYCFANGIYDYGTSNWNGLVQNFIPKSLFGSNFKDSLMFPNTNKSVIKKLTKSGSTMTGYFDAFASFGIFAFFKFFLLGLFMGVLWGKIEYSIISLLLYVASMSATLHTITHSTNNIVSELFFFFIFVYPFIKFCTVKTNFN